MKCKLSDFPCLQSVELDGVCGGRRECRRRGTRKAKPRGKTDRHIRPRLDLFPSAHPVQPRTRLREEWAFFRGGLGRRFEKTRHFFFSLRPLPDWPVLGEPLKGVVSCIFNPVSWGSRVALEHRAACWPGLNQTVGVSDCEDRRPRLEGRSNIRPHRLTAVKINTPVLN